jgi:ribosomal-protein-alanine N-acetyltransferase
MLDDRCTARLRLCRPQPADLDDYLAMHRDPRVMATLGGIKSDEHSTQAFQRHRAHWAEHGFGWWMVRDLATGKFIGRGGLRNVTVEGPDKIEVGYALIPEFWGRGLATELARESVRVGFELLNVPALISFTLPTNHASRRVMEKVSFKYDRNIIYAGLPHVLYRLTATEWRGPHDARRSPSV